ncbi:MAG: type II secretion system inner membrane protein GspF [Gammaproteobacteria bacterium]|nr:type II secretion system inner membrane protein GspF [Gammaproteobacteria bacterium]
MAAFEYIALDEKGKEKKGIIEADTAKQVRQLLRDKGLTPLQIDSTKASKKKSDKGTSSLASSKLFQRGINSTELCLITRQLATLVQAGLPLEESLAAVANQSEKPRIQSMMYAIRSKVLEGHTLAAGLSEYPKVFNQLFCATIEAGEKSGHLDTVLERLADYTENRQELQSKVSQAMIYPGFLTIFAILIVGFLMAYVVPQVVAVFDDIGEQLPGLTLGLITISDFVVNYGIYVIFIVIALVIGLKVMLQQPVHQERYHRLLLKLPLIQKLVRGLNTALFTRTFSILSGSGVAVLESMTISAQVVVNLPLRNAILAATDRVREGGSISQSLASSKLFPPITLQLIASGENSGKLEEMLQRASTQLEREQVTLIAFIVGIMEPIIISVMGLMVLLIVLGILLPIFDLNQLVK